MTIHLLYRLFWVTALVIVEIAAIAFVYEPRNTELFSLYSVNRSVFAGKIQPFILVFAFLFPILIWARREYVFPVWSESLKGYNWSSFLIINIVIFALLFVFTSFISAYPLGSDGLSFALNLSWHIALIVLLASILSVIAPISFWSEFSRKFYVETTLALLAAFFIIFVATISQSTWNMLSEATFHTSYWILQLYESDVFINVENRQLAVNGFLIRIDPQCSGYEGIGLIVAFLSVYIFAFRKSLRFPNVFLLYVIGVPLIWVLNALRIALLASLGGHISPEVAVTGFHSQAGWIMFLVVTVSLMVVSGQMAFFRSDLESGTEEKDPKEGAPFNLALALLAPFIAFMLASILVSAASSGNDSHWLYVIKVGAMVLALFFFRKYYFSFIEKVSPLSVVAGVFVAIVWIVMDWYNGHTSELGSWLLQLPVWAFSLWLAMRLFGTVFLVPIVEELAFRGYLHRALAARKFETVSFGYFTWPAFLISTLMFAAMHSGRFFEACIAGALFALVMYRTNRIADPIAAHMVANAVVAGWAILAGQWSLL